MKRRTRNWRSRALDVPYERDDVARVLASSGPTDLLVIALAYDLSHQAVSAQASRAMKRFRDRWVELYGTEPPDLVRRDWRGMEVA
jgi:hypothetical protein